MSFAEREIKFVRALYSVEVTETETATFETEIDEVEIHANWKLKGEVLLPSTVRTTPPPNHIYPTSFCYFYIFKAVGWKP